MTGERNTIGYDPIARLTTWKQVCDATGLDYANLPHTVDEAIVELNKSSDVAE